MIQNSSNYIFTSERLGFRNWLPEDMSLLKVMNSSPEVMKFFPFTLDDKQNKALFDKMKNMCDEKSYCYFMTEIKETKETIGFIGFADQSYKNELGDFVDIGWRINTPHWGKGYATEGAKKCLEYAFREIKLKEIYSVAPEINLPSISVMKKIGMSYDKTFHHPKLSAFKNIESCVLYKKDNPFLPHS